DAAPGAGEELAGEVRALRLWLQRSERGAGAPDAQEVLAPLRPVLEQLAATQREQGARQLALAQELQRWTQLVGEAAGAARAGELQALGERLRALEQTLAAQDARHREV